MVQNISFEQIRGSLGSLLLLWSGIERSARDEVARAHDGQLPKSAHGIAAVLNAWEATVAEEPDATQFRSLLASALRAQLKEPLILRNSICHGLVGVSASRDDQPASLTWELNGTKQSVTWDELHILFNWLSKLPSAIKIISRSPSERPGGRMTDTPENRDWWRVEFGIDLPDSEASAAP